MTSRVCSSCGLDICYDNNNDDKPSNGHWYPLATRGRRCLYFLCNNCYSKQQQTNNSKQGVYARYQNRRELDIKQKISKLKASLMPRIIFKSIE
jgi:hypothetical protein